MGPVVIVGSGAGEESAEDLAPGDGGVEELFDEAFGVAREATLGLGDGGGLLHGDLPLVFGFLSFGFVGSAVDDLADATVTRALALPLTLSLSLAGLPLSLTLPL